MTRVHAAAARNTNNVTAEWNNLFFGIPNAMKFTLYLIVGLLMLPAVTWGDEVVFYTSVPDSVLTANIPANGGFTFYKQRTEKGMFGHAAGKSRMYYNIELPPLTPALLIDVGMAMDQVGGLIGMAPRWFAMFSPLACTTDELYGFPKNLSSIMFVWRTYF